MRNAIVFRSRPHTIAALALLASSAPLQAQQSALTLDDAVHLATSRSQQLVAEAAAATAAREMAVAAGQGPDPVLMAGIVNMPVDGPSAFSLTDDFMTMSSIGLSRELTRGAKRDARVARFTKQAEAADAAGMLALVELQRGTALAWLSRYYRERAHAALLEQREQAALQIDAADIAFRSGLGPQSDLLGARLAVARIDDRIATSERDIRVATTELARWVGSDASRPLGEPPPMNRVALHPGNLEDELAHHPEIALMTRHEEVADADVEIARAGKRADWTIDVMYGRRGPDFSNMMSVNFSKPLQWRERDRQDREVAATIALARRAQAEREEATREHVAQAQSLLAAWEANRARLQRYTATLIPLAAERANAAIAAYRSGTGTLTGALDARVGEIDVRLEELALALETAALWAELTFLVPAGVDHE